MTAKEPEIVIVGAGVAGLTLALTLHDVGVHCRVYEAVPELAEVGVGINVLPHATRVLAGLGLEEALASVAVETKEAVFFNRFGQRIYSEPLGRFADLPWPQFSIHRGDLQTVLVEAVVDRLGQDAILLGHRCVGFEETGDRVTVRFESPDGDALPAVNGHALIGCDGVHSEIRRQLHPGEGPPRYSGFHMWRGVTVHEPFLSGASMVRAGWLETGKMVIYPIRENIDGAGNQLVNWVAEVRRERRQERDWNRAGQAEDFIHYFEDWTFDWLDVPALIHGAEQILEYPMVDQDPLERWTSGRTTLAGDAAHPMVPRGSNGAGQAILDAQSLARHLSETDDVARALLAYEAERRPATGAVVEMNRTNPPDAILREVYERTGDQPFERIEDVIDPTELRRITQRYESVAGYSSKDLTA